MHRITFIMLLVALTNADHINKNAETNSLVNDVNPDGSFQYSFDTTNGIQVQETGAPGGVSVSGSAQWVSLEGEPIQLVYTADENGYQPQSANLPTPPPVPEYILRAIEYIKAHPYVEPKK